MIQNDHEAVFPLLFIFQCLLNATMAPLRPIPSRLSPVIPRVSGSYAAPVHALLNAGVLGAGKQLSALRDFHDGVTIGPTLKQSLWTVFGRRAPDMNMVPAMNAETRIAKAILQDAFVLIAPRPRLLMAIHVEIAHVELAVLKEGAGVGESHCLP